MNTRPLFSVIRCSAFVIHLLIAWVTVGFQVRAFAQGTAFTYQGRLTDNGSPANGNYDMRFYLRDAPGGGNPVGATNTLAPVPASNGLFTVTLDFGVGIFNGNPRWLEIGVRTNGSVSAYTTLSPRQALTAAPYAITSSNLSGTLPAAQLTGVLPSALLAGTYSSGVTFSNPSNSFSGAGSGLTNLIATNISAGTLADARLSTNVALLNASQTFKGTNVFSAPLGVGATNSFEPLLNIGGGDWSKVSITTTGVVARARLGQEVQAGVMSYNACLAPSGWTRDDTNRPSLAYLQHLSNNRHEFRVSPAGAGLIPWNTAMTIETNGNVGIAASPAAGQLTIGTYQGGTVGSAVSNYAKQVIISGPFNTGFNNGNSVKLLISDYDNDASDIFPLYVEDENNGVDFFLHSQPGLKTAFFGGSVGIGTTTPTAGNLLHLRGFQGAALFETTGSGNGSVLQLKNGLASPTLLGAINFLDSVNNVPGQIAYRPGGISSMDFRVGNTFRVRFDQQVHVYRDNGTEALTFYPNDGVGNSALDVIGTGPGNGGVQLLARPSNGGFLTLTRADGTQTISATADDGTGFGLITTSVLQITGGADLSEQFDVRDVPEPSSALHAVAPGMVVCIDPDHPGELVVSTKPYDRTVAGIVSGAGGVKTGMMMGHQGTLADGKHPVALTGRVYCLADASNGPIQAGDLLTTSSTLGRAMKVTDPVRAQGAILGKAMSALQDGHGLVLALVTLQ